MAEQSPPSNESAALLALINQGLATIAERRADLTKEILAMTERPKLTIPKGLLDDDIATAINAQSNSADFGLKNFLLLLQAVRILRAGTAAPPPTTEIEVES